MPWLMKLFSKREMLVSTCVVKRLGDFCTSKVYFFDTGCLSLTSVKGIDEQYINKIRVCTAGPAVEMN